jgi:hypothetical protein
MESIEARKAPAPTGDDIAMLRKHGKSSRLEPKAPEDIEVEHLSVVELCLKHSNLSEYITQVETDLKAEIAISRLEARIRTLEGNTTNA